MKLRLVLALLFAALLSNLPAASAFAAEKRIALVIGESAYRAKPLATAANDAGLIAQTLQAAGFDVAGARDLDEEGLRGALRDFVDKAGASGPETVAFVYFSGLALQLEGENYLVPVDAAISRDADIALRAVRVSDYVKPLTALGLKAAVVVLDAARPNPFTLTGEPIAGGLALFEPGPGLLLAYNAAPGTVAPEGAGPYGAYAQALAEMIRAGGMPLGQVFEQTRLRVAETTKGAQIPWNSTNGNNSFLFFNRTAQAPARGVDDAALQTRPIGQFSAQDAYAAAIARDTIAGYQEFLVSFPGDPLAKRVRLLLAARREALIWRRARILDSGDAYWSYLRRYPHGPHAYDARRMLAARAIALEPPQAFAPVDMGYPPPPPEEIVYMDRPVIYFDDPSYGFGPPPPPPGYFLPPPPPDFVVLAPPYVVVDAYVLPMPAYIPVPVYIETPAYIVRPPNNPIFDNLHNSVAIDRGSNALVVKNPEGHVLSSTVLTAVGAGAIGAALPHFIAKKFGTGAPPAHGGAGAPAGGQAPAGHALPIRPTPVGSTPPAPSNEAPNLHAPHEHRPVVPPTGAGGSTPPPPQNAPALHPSHEHPQVHRPVVPPTGAGGSTPPSPQSAPPPRQSQEHPHEHRPVTPPPPHNPPPAPHPAAAPAPQKPHCVKENGKEVCH